MAARRQEDLRLPEVMDRNGTLRDAPAVTAREHDALVHLDRRGGYPRSVHKIRRIGDRLPIGSLACDTPRHPQLDWRQCSICMAFWNFICWHRRPFRCSRVEEATKPPLQARGDIDLGISGRSNDLFASI
jgi:hypothetical protein